MKYIIINALKFNGTMRRDGNILIIKLQIAVQSSSWKIIVGA